MTKPTDAEQQMHDAMELFKQSYNSGYKLLMKEMKETPQASADGLKMLDNPEKFKKFLAEGKPISDVLGFSPESIDKFYEAAHHLMEQKRFKDAKDAFFFLVTIAPHVSECWLGLGLACGQCKEAEGAMKSFLRAIALSPHKADGYVAFARLFTAMNDIPRANKVCEIGMSFVKEHEKLPWAKELEKALQQTKKELAQHK